MAYSIRPLDSFENSFKKLDRQIARRAIQKLENLAQNPEIIGGPMANLPKDLAGLHKARVGDWRVFFWVDRNRKEIVPYLVDRRDIIYKKLFEKK
ncbi:MAG: type II toxin-antitoxin system RelE/ParE family toxin [Patescibacteria group bacterium]